MTYSSINLFILMIILISEFLFHSAYAGETQSKACTEIFLSSTRANYSILPEQIRFRSRQGNNSFFSRRNKLNDQLPIQLPYLDDLMERALLEVYRDPVSGFAPGPLFRSHSTFGELDAAELARYHKTLFRKLSPKQILDLTAFFVERYPKIMMLYGDVFPMSDSQKVSVFIHFARGEGHEGHAVIQRSDYGVNNRLFSTFLELAYGPIQVPKDQQKRIVRMAFLNNAMYILRVGGLKDILPIPTGNDINLVKERIYQIAELYPFIISSQEARVIFESVYLNSSENGISDLDLIDVWLKLLSQRDQLADRNLPDPQSPIDILGHVLGYNVRDIRSSSLSVTEMKQLFKLSSDLSFNLVKPPFDNVKIHPSIWNRTYFHEFLDILRDLGRLNKIYGNNQNSWERIAREVGFTPEEFWLNPSVLPRIKRDIRELMLEGLSDLH